MSTFQRFMKTTGVLAFAGAAAIAAVALTGASSPVAVEDAVKIGTYNPQEAFNQYEGMQEFQRRSQELQQQMQEAQQQGDQQRMFEIQNQLQMQQEQVIEEFFEAVEKVVPEVADENGVQIVAVDIVYSAPDIGEPEDLTQKIISEVNAQAGGAQERDEPDTPGELPW